MDNEKTIYETTLTAAINAVRILYLSGFVTESENAHINERIGKYTDRYREITGEIIRNGKD